jgi:hypothetical protein
MTPKTVRYQLGRWDTLDWLVLHLIRHPFLWVVAVGLTGFRCWTLFRDGYAQSIPLLAFHGSLTFAVVWIGFFIVITPLVLFRRQPGLGRDIEFTVFPEHFVSESSLGRSEIKWAAIRNLRRGWAHTFLCVSSDQAILLPDRAFDDPASRQAFDAYCRERIAAARAGVGRS